MTTKCYEVILREYGLSFNSGHIIVQSEEDKIKSVKGVLTCDYIDSKIVEDNIMLIYYKMSDNFIILHPYFRISIKNQYSEFPGRIALTVENTDIELKIEKIIEDEELIQYHEKRIDHFKNTNIFLKIQ